MCWTKNVIETGEFYCSRFWDLNDPMEGVYTSKKLNSSDFVKKTFDEKGAYVICSFSGERALTDPLMWCHYANGFRGIAIEVTVSAQDTNILPVMYSADVPMSSDVRKILTTKLCAWRYECEHRYLIIGKPKPYDIGEITAIYIGHPHMALINKDGIEEKVDSVRQYRETREDVIRTIDKNISIHYAYLDGQYVRTCKIDQCERERIASEEN